MNFGFRRMNFPTKQHSCHFFPPEIGTLPRECARKWHLCNTLLSAFYRFLQVNTPTPPANPVIPRRHFTRQGLRLPRDVNDATLEKLLAVVTSPRDRAMFLIMLRCGLRVGEIRRLSMTDLDLKPAPGLLPRLYVTGKGGKQRVVYLSAQPLQALRGMAGHPAQERRPGRFSQSLRPPLERDRHPQSVYLFRRHNRFQCYNERR